MAPSRLSYWPSVAWKAVVLRQSGARERPQNFWIYGVAQARPAALGTHNKGLPHGRLLLSLRGRLLEGKAASWSWLGKNTEDHQAPPQCPPRLGGSRPPVVTWTVSSAGTAGEGSSSLRAWREGYLSPPCQTLSALVRMWEQQSTLGTISVQRDRLASAAKQAYMATSACGPGASHPGESPVRKAGWGRRPSRQHVGPWEF